MTGASESAAGATLLVLTNERAGLGGTGAADRVRQALLDAGVEAIVRPVSPDALYDSLRTAMDEGVDRVGISGGDGTILAAAGVLAGGETALGAIPSGTLNHFARRLGVGEIAEAAACLVGGRFDHAPVGVVDDHIFLNTATFGLYADVVRQRERLRRWLTKWPAAAIALTARLVRMQRLQVVLEVEGEQLVRHTPLVWVGVGWGSFPRVHLAPERRGTPDLEIVVLRPSGRFGVLGLSVRFFKHLFRGNRPVSDPALEVIHARNVLIHASHRMGVTLDGEVLRLRPPVFIGIVDDALRVLVPSAAEEEGSSDAGKTR